MRRSSLLAVPLRQPADVAPHLGKPTHWKQGRSAKALADAWFAANGIRPAVRDVIATSDYLAGAEFLDGWLERETDLRDGRATPSQTDLLGLIGGGDKLGVLGVEAKVDESFGPLVSEWLTDAGSGKLQRLRHLCTLLNLEPDRIGSLRYQLLHRTAATLLEARRFRSDIAVLIVQSFCAQATGFKDCVAFFESIGMPGSAAGELIGARRFGTVDLWVGWASDTPIPDKNRWEDSFAEVGVDLPRDQPHAVGAEMTVVSA